jgi:nitroimidazol reductase NimA-like FMN-containing flavoprotein (pyridoxamine 5'-phosphate oxidase superfamily)
MHESPETLAQLQAIIDRSAASAGPAIRRNFIGGGWAMSAAEFVAFWGETRMATVSTASRHGTVHAVPLDIHLVDGKFYIPTFPDSHRLQDHRANPRCAITSWDGPYRAVIVYGSAREVPADPTRRTAATAAEQGYTPDAMATVEVTPTRIYAIRPPPGHHAAAQPVIGPSSGPEP